MFWLIWADLPHKMLGIWCVKLIHCPSLMIFHLSAIFFYKTFSCILEKCLFGFGALRTQDLLNTVHLGLLDRVHNRNLNIFEIAKCALRKQPNLVSSISKLAKIKLNMLSPCSAYESDLGNTRHRRGAFRICLFATYIYFYPY